MASEGEKLIAEIHGGIKLRPTQTQDRSAPVVCVEGEKLKRISSLASTTTYMSPEEPDSIPQPSEQQLVSPPPPPPLPPALLTVASAPVTSASYQNKTPRKSSVNASTASSGAFDRDKLMGDIQKGARLKKAVTNDRSQPAIPASSFNFAPKSSDEDMASQLSVAQTKASPHRSPTSLASPALPSIMDELVQNTQFNNSFKKTEEVDGCEKNSENGILDGTRNGVVAEVSPKTFAQHENGATVDVSPNLYVQPDTRTGIDLKSEDSPKELKPVKNKSPAYFSKYDADVTSEEIASNFVKSLLKTEEGFIDSGTDVNSGDAPITNASTKHVHSSTDNSDQMSDTVDIKKRINSLNGSQSAVDKNTNNPPTSPFLNRLHPRPSGGELIVKNDGQPEGTTRSSSNDNLCQEMAGLFGTKAMRTATGSLPRGMSPITSTPPSSKTENTVSPANKSVTPGFVTKKRQSLESSPPPIPTTEPPPIVKTAGPRRLNVSSLRSSFETSNGKNNGVKTSERKFSSNGNTWSPMSQRKVSSTEVTPQNSMPEDNSSGRLLLPVRCKVFGAAVDAKSAESAQKSSLSPTDGSNVSSQLSIDSSSEAFSSSAASSVRQTSSPSPPPMYLKEERLLPDVGRLTSRFENIRASTTAATAPVSPTPMRRQDKRDGARKGSLLTPTAVGGKGDESSATIRQTATDKNHQQTMTAELANNSGDRPWLVKKSQIGNRLANHPVTEKLEKEINGRLKKNEQENEPTVTPLTKRTAAVSDHLEISDETFANMTPEFMHDNFKFSINVNSPNTILFQKR